jgi:hypothetical protein
MNRFHYIDEDETEKFDLIAFLEYEFNQRVEEGDVKKLLNKLKYIKI